MKNLRKKLLCLACALALCLTQIVPVMADDENPLAGAKNLGTSGSVSGTLESDGMDYYKYTVAAGSSVALKATVTAYEDDITIGVYNAGGNNTKKIHIYRNSDTNQRTETVVFYLNPGTYYISLWSYYGARYQVNYSTEMLNNTDIVMDDTIASAHSIPLTGKVTGVVSEVAEDEVDIYKLNVEKAGTLKYDFKFYMNKIDLKLLDKDGEEINSKVFYWNDNLMMGTEQFEFAVEPGTYYIEILRDYGDGKYEFNQIYTDIGSTETEPNNSLEQAQTIQLGEKVTGMIGVGGDTDFFRIDIPSKRNVTFSVPSKTRLSLYIYDRDGNEIEYASTDWNDNTRKGTISRIYKLSKGTYYVQIKGHWSDSFGTYTLTASTTKAPTKGKITTIKRTKKNWWDERGIYLKWKKSANAEGYQIYVASNSKFRNADKYTTDKRSYTTWSYKTGKTYYVKVRGYRQNSDGEYIYGKFSAVKKIKL